MFGRKNANILVIKTDGLTGFVAAEPAFDAIRKRHPDAQISLLTIPTLQRLARAASYFDQVAAMPNFRDPQARKEFVKQLRAAKFERVYDLANDDAGKKLRGAMGMFGPKWHSAPSAPKKTRKGAAALALPDTDAMLDSAGVERPNRLPDFRWALDARKDSANMKPSWYGISGAFGLLMPGRHAEQRWTPSGYAGLSKIMTQAGFMPVLAGPKELHDFGDRVAEESPQLVDLTGKTDHLQLAALAQEAAFFVSDGAEEIHLAVSIGCEGVLVANPKSIVAAPPGRHVVTLTSQSGLGAVDPAFVWRTLSNMGLIDVAGGPPQSASAR